MAPVGRPAFDFPALTYFSERSSDRIPYLTLFPVGNTMRANLFTYREMDDPWLRQMRRAPEETLNASLPRLRKLTGNFKVAGEIKIRPADLYVSTGYRQPGIVLVGDAFATSCPVTGTGTDKVFTDVERLCNVHIPDWLTTRRHGRGQDRGVLRRSGQDGMRRVVGREGLQLPLGDVRQRPFLAGPALGPFCCRLERRHVAAGAQPAQDRVSRATASVGRTIAWKARIGFWSGRRESNPHLQFGNCRSAIELHPRDEIYHRGESWQLISAGGAQIVKVGVNFLSPNAARHRAVSAKFDLNRRHRRRRHRRPRRRAHAADGPDRPTACDRHRSSPATGRANRARSPCRC